MQGPFAGYADNRKPMLKVIKRHQQSCRDAQHESLPQPLQEAAQQVWSDCYAHGKQHGYRNAQVTLLAPTGTIAFMMDCDTTGIEPDLALVKYKKLVGGGGLKIVNNTVPRALACLGYTPQQIDNLVQHIDEHGTMEGAPDLQEDHLPVFDCAFPAMPGGRSIHYSGHLRMVAAVQPFLSGSVSKTINVPNQATVADIEQAYLDAWDLGIKCVAIYRDGCKRTQPLNTKAVEPETASAPSRPMRRRLPDERPAITHKFSIAGHEGYITVGMFEDGTPGEIFLVMAKEGSTISGLMDAFATSISLAFQYGVPLRALIDKFSHMRFEPAGFTNNTEIPLAKSVMDYIFRWLASKFLDQEERAQIGVHRPGRPGTDRRTRDPQGGQERPPLPLGHHRGALLLPVAGRRPPMRRMRLPDDPQRRLLQMPQLRHHERVFVGDTAHDPLTSEQKSVHMNNPCHPGEVLRDWISGHGKTIQEAAELMGVSRATLNRLLSGVGRIAPKLAVQLESMGWSTAEMWLRLQMAHDLAAARRAKPVA